MNPFRIALVILCVVGLLAPTASAQICTNPTPINCGESLPGTTVGGPRNIDTHGACYGWLLVLGEAYFIFTPATDVVATITLTQDAWDGAVSVFPDDGAGDCLPDGCIAGADAEFGPPEIITGLPLTAGQTYYIVVDGYDDPAPTYPEGTFTLDLACEICIDADGDGANAFDAANCPSGTDCCDDGTEGGPGCDAVNAPNIFPGAVEVCENGIDDDCDGIDASCTCDDLDGDGVEAASCGGEDCCDDGSEGGLGCDVTNAPNINPDELEICGDGIDNDCDGNDDACLGCVSDAVISCDDTGQIDTATDGANNFITWCGSTSTGWTGNEYIWEHTALADGALLMETVNTVDIDISVMASFGGGECNPNLCYGRSWQLDDSDEVAGVYAEAGQTYFFAVDEWGTAGGVYDYTFSCLDESCAEDGTLACGESVVARNVAAVNSISIYEGISTALMAKDVAYAFSHPFDATVTINGDSAVELGIFVLENSCDPTSLIALAYNTPQPAETLEFDAAAGATYFIVADGTSADQEGTIDLSVDCAVECGTLTECTPYQCVDTQTDPSNCLACGTVCNLDNTDTHNCVAGTCEVLACDPGFDNCDGANSTGCETTLGTPTDCSSCGDACGGATPFCSGGVCTDVCPGGLTDCSGACVDTDTDLLHCGGCDSPCNLTNTDTHVCTTGTCEVVTCDAGFDNCDGANSTGCEVALGTVTDCGSCGDVCAYDNAADECNAGVCAMGACDAGFEDCDASAANGCEVALGTVADCGGCGVVCAYDNATPECNAGACEMGACDADFGDCDGDPASGCETGLITDTDCGACGTTCTLLEVCADQGAGWVCTSDCDDADADGYADNACGGPDCDDAEATVNPGADEACNAIDDDCDGVVDEGFDADGDGYADDSQCTGADLDCDDADPSVNPGAVEVCGDGVDQDCNGSDLACACADSDHDGFADAACEGGTDCNDNDAHIFPGAEEECDGLDNDCDGVADQDDTCAAGPGCNCSASSSAPFSGAVLIFVALGLAALRKRDD